MWYFAPGSKLLSFLVTGAQIPWYLVLWTTENSSMSMGIIRDQKNQVKEWEGLAQC